MREFIDRCQILLTQFGNHPGLAETLRAVEYDYKACERIYHDARHIHRMFDELDKWRSQLTISPRRLAALELAVIYHDVVYIPGRKDNETLSAERAVRDLTDLNFPKNFICLVEKAILATTNHICHRRDVVSCLLVDLDLCSMANDDEYLENGQRIRDEFSVYNDQEFFAGRIAFLNSFLGRRRLFRSPFGHLYEANARRNMQADLRRNEARQKVTT